MNAPTHYADIAPLALEVQAQYQLSDTQLRLYNHICRGDFKLRNGDGQAFYDSGHKGFGWSKDREWVKEQLKTLISKGVVKFTSLKDCRDPRYTSWYFSSPKHDLQDLVDAACYVSTHKLAMIKHYLGLPDGFNKRNAIYGDLELLHNDKGYTFKYKGAENIYYWDYNGKGQQTGQSTLPLYQDNFQELLHDIWSFLAHEGKVYLNRVPNYRS